MKKIIVLFISFIASASTAYANPFGGMIASSGTLVSYSVGIGSYSSNGGASTTSIVVTAPTGITDGNLLIAFVNNDNYGSGTACTPPTGFSEIAFADYGSDLDLRAFQKIASSEGSNYTFTFAGTTNASIVIYRLTKTGGSFSETDSASTILGTTLTVGTVDAVEGSAMIASFGSDGAQTVTTPPSGMDAGGLYTGVSCDLRTYYQLYSSDSPGVSKSITYSASDQNAGIIVLVMAQ